MPLADSPSSLDTRILRRVQRSTPGSVFTPATFAKLGSREAIDKALQRHVQQGTLRRLSRGLYDKPRHDSILGTLWPSVEEVVKALTGQRRIRTQPTGVYAANLLGLSEQVPARVVLLTDGATRSVRAGPMLIELKRTTPRNMAAANRLSGLVIQALKNLGREHVARRHIEHLRRTIPATERAKLVNDLQLAPGWMWPILREIAEKMPRTTKGRVAS